MDELSPNSAAVATHHPEGAKAAAKVFAKNGNAVDAAVAAMLALCVVLPGSVGIGGYGGCLVVFDAKRRKTFAIDFDSRAPFAYRDELYAKPQAAQVGYLAVTVPGIVAGLDFARREFGTMSWRELSEHATDLAENGFLVDEYSRKVLTDWSKKTDAFSLRAMFRESVVPDIGKKWVQKDLARLLRHMSDEGPEAFYRGEIMQRIVTQVRDNGGILAEGDFTDFRPTLEEPLAITYRGFALFTPPPPSGGITTLQTLKILENFDLAHMPPWGADYLHLFAEATKLCFADRAKYLGDPDFVTIPFDLFLGNESAAQKATQLRTRAAERSAAPDSSSSSPHTSNVSTIDKLGNTCSVTATQGYQFGSQVVIDGLGLVMGHGMSRFTFTPGSPNAPAPNKRMFHNMAPTIITRDGIPRWVMGLPGGPKIVTVTAQLAVNVIDFKCTPKQAVTAPRVHTEGSEPLNISYSVPDDVAAQLEKFGHTLTKGQTVGGPTRDIGGYSNVIAIDPQTGEVDAYSGAGSGASKII